MHRAALAAETTEPCDAALVSAARSGDRAALSRLYQRYAPVVHGVLLSRIPPADAEDLLQEVFMNAMAKLDSLRDPGSIGPWLAASARNAAATFQRGRRRSDGLPDGLEAAGPVGPAAAEASEALAAIRSLPEAYRETLMLRLVEGLTGPEIAARTGMTPGSVRVNLHRGMAVLREKLGAPATGERREVHR